jgi:YihY family inner membrane protein
VDVLRPIRRFDAFQRRHAWLAIPVAVLRNLSDQGAGQASVLIAYWAFFSIFPLLLVFAAVLGFVLQGNPEAQRSLLHSALQQFPIIGADLRSLGGSKTGVGIGIVGTVWAGLAVTLAAQNAFNRVYSIPHYKQADFLVSRLRGLSFLAVVGVLQIISTVASGLVSGGLGGVWLVLAGIVFSLAVNLVLFAMVFRFLVPGAVRIGELWPGIVLAAVGWEVLQAVGGIYVHHVIKGAGQTYGTFATVIGLLAWLYLGARIVVFAAEINVVLTRRLWPRSILDPPEPADRRARAALAKMEERDDKQTIEVAFHPPDRDKRIDLHNPPYAVAPAPAPGESAVPASPKTAPADLHTLTVSQVLEAIDQELEDVAAPDEARHQARRWLWQARTHLPQSDDGAAGALAEATQRALGLAGIEEPAHRR